MTDFRPAFAGGGSGGHIAPALAIAEYLRTHQPDPHFAFLCSPKPVDARMIDAANHTPTPIPARPIAGHPARLATGLASLAPAVHSARSALRQHRCSVLAAFGGYVAAPAVIAARTLRIPVCAVNIDARAGLANRLLARLAHRRLAAGYHQDGWEPITPIVRAALLERLEPAHARRTLNLDPDRPTLLITGGSLGAQSLNRFVLTYMRTQTDTLEGWQIIHQTGPAHETEARQTYLELGLPALVQPFFDDMQPLWASADLAITRGGANTVAELWATHTPALVLPYPHHRDEHQRHNAEPLERAGLASIARDFIDPDHNIRAHAHNLGNCLTDRNVRSAMRRAGQRLGPARGTAQLAHVLETLSSHHSA